MSKTWTKHFEEWISGLDFDPSATEAFRAGWLASEPHLPTREQIAEAIYRGAHKWEDLAWQHKAAWYERADAVLALLQKGADR